MPPISLQIVSSKRIQRIRITIHQDLRVVITKPYSVSDKKALAFAEEKRLWIETAYKKIASKNEKVTQGETIEKIFTKKHSKEEEAHLKKEALKLVEERLPELNALYGFFYKKMSIRNQSTRWGSCSARKTLSFNYRIILLPPHLQDYLLTHELCHLQEMNHSSRFWKLIEKTIPLYKEHRKELRAL